MPHILTANDLDTGDVIFWTGAAWSRHLPDAILLVDGEAALPDVIGQPASRLAVDAYAIEAEATDQGPRPIRNRERLRALGPSVRRDLNRTAGVSHVSV
jgi:hypothetical protein